MKVSVLTKKNQINKMILRTKRIKENQNPKNNNRKINKRSNLPNKRKKKSKRNKKRSSKRNKRNNNRAIKISNNPKHLVSKMILTKFQKTIEQMLNHK